MRRLASSRELLGEIYSPTHIARVGTGITLSTSEFGTFLGQPIIQVSRPSGISVDTIDDRGRVETTILHQEESMWEILSILLVEGDDVGPWDLQPGEYLLVFQSIGTSVAGG